MPIALAELAERVEMYQKNCFCERNESACAYGLPKHRHLEIEEQLSHAISSKDTLFHPHLAPMNRGICSTISVLLKEK